MDEREDELAAEPSKLLAVCWHASTVGCLLSQNLVTQTHNHTLTQKEKRFRLLNEMTNEAPNQTRKGQLTLGHTDTR